MNSIRGKASAYKLSATKKKMIENENIIEKDSTRDLIIKEERLLSIHLFWLEDDRNTTEARGISRIHNSG